MARLTRAAQVAPTNCRAMSTAYTRPGGRNDGVALVIDLAPLGLETLAPLLVIRVAVRRIDFGGSALASRKPEEENACEEEAESAHGAG
jgi:hypothetical protein